MIPNSPLSVLGVSSHLFLRADGVPLPPPGVVWPGVEGWAGVASHRRVLWPGVAPGVSDPLGMRPGVSSHLVLEGVWDCERRLHC